MRREADENCVLLGCYAASSGNSLTEVSGQHTGPETSGTTIRCVITQKNEVVIHSPLVSTQHTILILKTLLVANTVYFDLHWSG